MKSTFLLFLFLTGPFLLKTTAQQPGAALPIFTQKAKYTTTSNTIGNSIPFGSLYSSNSNTFLMLTKSHKWSQPNISGSASIPNKNFWKAQGNGGGEVGKGALIGMGVGAVLGGLIGLVSYKKPPPPKSQIVIYSSDLGRGGSAAIGALAGLTSGALLGAFIGLARKNQE